MEDIQSICGRGAYLHFNHYDNADHDTKPRRIQSTKTALMAMFGNGGIDRDIWTYYTDASTTTAAAAAQTIASRAGGVGIGIGYGASAVTTPASGASKHGTPSSITSKHGGAGTTPSSASRRPPSVLRSSNRTNGTALSTVSENVVSFKDQIKKEINDDGIDEIAEEEEEDGDDDGTYNDEESIKSKEDSDEENSLEPVKKKRKPKTPKPTRKTKTTPKTSSVDNQETPTSSSEMKTPSRKASSSRKKKSASKADSLDNNPSGTVATSSKTKVVVTSLAGDGTKEILVAPTTTVASLRDYYLQSMHLTEHLPETWKFTHKGLLLEKDTILTSLVPPGMELHLQAIMDVSPIRIDMFDGSIVEI